MRNRDLREFCVQVNLPSPIQLVWVPIRCLITPIQRHRNPIWQVVPLISHISSYPAHHFHFHPPSLSFSSTTQTSSQNTKLSHPSPSLHAMIMSWHRVPHTPSTTYTDYSIHPWLFVFPSFSWIRVDPWMELQLPACLPTRSTAISHSSLWELKGKVPLWHFTHLRVN